MRLLLVGAFPYPHHQGSQVYFQEQAIALRSAGAQVELLTYGRADEGAPEHPERWRALDGFVHHTLPPTARPRSTASGPSISKIRADLEMRHRLNDAIASNIPRTASYDAILAHHFESCVISSASRVIERPLRIPVVYCVHTLLHQELSAYLKSFKFSHLENDRRPGAFATHRIKKGIDWVGGRLDRWAARRCDGWIALTHSAARVMEAHSRGPGAIVAPPLPDPRHRFFDDPQAARLPQRSYFLYTGNLDGYQELHLLEGAARVLSERFDTPPRIVLASFDPSVADPNRRWAPGIEPRHVASEAEMQALTAAARATIVPRLAVGGFPIKLANSLANGTAPITFYDREWGLEAGKNVEVADPARPVEGLADAIGRLSADSERAESIGRKARDRYEAAHRPAVTAEQTLGLIEEVRIAARGGH